METKQKRTKIVVSVLALAGLLVFSLLAIAGNLEPIPPSTSTMQSFDEIYDLRSSTAQSGLAGANGYGMLTGMYIKFDGVDGEAQDRDHRKWCDAISFSQGQSLPGDGTGATRRRGNVVFEDIVVIKELDKASPKLAEAVCKGKVFPKVEIHLTRQYANAGPVTYYAYELKNVLIVAYNIGGSSYSADIPTEEISFSFEEIKVTYTETDETGATKGSVEYQWRVEDSTF